MRLQLQLTVICSLVSFCLAHYGGSDYYFNPQPGESCTPSYSPITPCGERTLIREQPETERLTQKDGFMGPNVCGSLQLYEFPTYSYSYKKIRYRCRSSWGYLRPCGERISCESTGVCNGTVYRTKKRSIGCCDGFTTTDGGKKMKTDTIRSEGCPVIVRDNVVQCLEDLGLTLFADELVNVSQLAMEINDNDTKLTIFAPPNEAFDDIDDVSDSDLMMVILGHIASGTIVSKRFSKGRIISTRANDVNLHVGVVKSRRSRRRPKKNYFLNGVRVTNTDACKTSSGNGIVHIVETFIPISENTTAEVLESQSDLFSTFNRLLEGADIMRFLRNAKKSRTVFAPTNEAFDKLPSGAAECLLRRQNRKYLKSLVLIHIAAPAEYSSTLMERSRLPTFSKYRLVITSRNDTIAVTRDEIPIQELDIPANNGVIHVLPTVIVPPEIDFDKICPTDPSTTTQFPPSFPIDIINEPPLNDIVPAGLVVGAEDM